MEAQTSKSQTPNITELYDALLEGKIESFLELLRKDPLILDRCIIEKPSACTQPLLHVASAKGRLQIIETLATSKPQMCYAYDQDGNTPIHVAVVNHQSEALKIFLQKEPLAVREPTSRGETVLHMCVKTKQPEVLRFLLGIPKNDNGQINSRDGNTNADMNPAVARSQMIKTPRQPETGSNASVDQRKNNRGGDSLASMCLVRDQNGRTPMHVAAANGRIEELGVLHFANRYAAQERTKNGESILHLCIKNSQLDALKKLIKLNDDDGGQLINSKDDNGNTILHLAVTYKEVEMVRYLLEDCKSSLEINAANKNDMTAVDVYKKQSKGNLVDGNIKKYLKRAKAKRAKDTLYRQVERLEDQRNALMVVASLIAGMAFQAGINPPGGVYQDTRKGYHEAGFAIWPYYYNDNHYNIALISNTVGFVSSISVITLLISGLPFKKEYLITILRVTLWIAVVAISITYAAVLSYVTKAHDPPLLVAVVTSYFVWVYVMTFILSANVAGFFWRRKDSTIRCFKKCFAPRNNTNNHSNNNP